MCYVTGMSAAGMIDDDTSEPIRMGGRMPGFLRGGLIVVGLGICGLVIHELGGGLWPFSILSVFFGIILFGGLTVGASIALMGWLAPDEEWTIRPGEIALSLMRGPHRLERRYAPDDFDTLGVVRKTDSDGPDTWHIEGQLRLNSAQLILSPEREPVFAGLSWLRWINAPHSLLKAGPAYQDRVRTPGFSREDAAERALAMFRAL
ncbi:MAG: hypothetical protein QM667_00650 [Asticcacaulis sp.]